MELLSPSHLYLNTCILALANHWVFHIYEPTRLTFFPTLMLLLAEPLSLCLLSASMSPSPTVKPFTIVQATTIAAVYVIFYVTLATSIMFYRISPFHPLAKIPGPTMYKLSKLWAVWKYRHAKHHLILKELHDVYGPVVRIGPNDLSVINTDAISPVLGAQGLPKGTSYARFRDSKEHAHMPKSLLILSGDQHKNRRRLWNRAMSSESLKQYEPVITSRAQQLVEGIEVQMKENEGRRVDLGQLLNYFAFDFMSDLGFGGGSDMLKDGADLHGRWDMITNHIFYAALLSQIDWLPRFFDNKIPWLARRVTVLPALARKWSMQRIQNGAIRKDVWYHLKDEAGLEKQKPTIPNVSADAVLVIIAGADTTSLAMTTLFWLLLSNPESYKRAQEEVDKVFPAGSDPLDVSKHSDLPYLTACVNECIRLYPPVPVGGSREVPKGSGGKIISGYFLPEGTQIYLPPYAIHRDPRNFSPRTEEFVPDRWLSSTSEPSRAAHDENFENNLKSFMPFSYGPANCAGKNLARQEMLMVMSLLIQKFEFEFADGFDAKGWEDTIGSMFATFRGPLEVRATLRK